MFETIFMILGGWVAGGLFAYGALLGYFLGSDPAAASDRDYTDGYKCMAFGLAAIGPLGWIVALGWSGMASYGFRWK